MRKAVEPPVCIALDEPDLLAARRVLDAVGGAVPVFKIGLELFCAEGSRAVDEVVDRGAGVFLDLKVNDIPKQAGGAVRAAARMGAAYLTVHGNGGRAMVREAVAAATDGPQVLVVSVLTSLDDRSLRELGVGRGAAEQVDAMAGLADEEGAPGLVLAAGEVRRVRASHPGLFLVTPGIRPATADHGDQVRVGSPGEAVAAGADLLVVGRAVTEARDPAAALDAVLSEISRAQAGVSG